MGTPSSSKRKIWKSRSISGTIPLPFGVFTNEFHVEEAPEATAAAARISVPPSDLHQHLGSLLRTEKGADVVFDVAGETFAAQRCVLAARSPVFSAELFGCSGLCSTSFTPTYSQ